MPSSVLRERCATFIQRKVLSTCFSLLCILNAVHTLVEGKTIQKEIIKVDITEVKETQFIEGEVRLAKNNF